MPFFEYHQNNSGGNFVYDAAGVSVSVIIEAADYRRANWKAIDLGLYFDGEGDCTCCGSRWSSMDSYDIGDEVPSTYGQSLLDPDTAVLYPWMKDKPEGFVHYEDGRIQAIFPDKEIGANKHIHLADWHPVFERLISDDD